MYLKSNYLIFYAGIAKYHIPRCNFYPWLMHIQTLITQKWCLHHLHAPRFSLFQAITGTTICLKPSLPTWQRYMNMWYSVCVEDSI